MRPPLQFISQSFPQMQLQMLRSVVLFISIGFCAAENGRFLECDRLFFSCGETIRQIGYPFWGGDRPRGCGLRGMELRCRRDNITTIDVAGQSFAVQDIGNGSMRIAQTDLMDDPCNRRHESTRLTTGNDEDDPQLRYAPNVENLYLFYSSCPSFNMSAEHRFNCSTNGTGSVGYVVDEPFQVPNATTGFGCNITIPVMRRAMEEFIRNGTTALGEVVNQGFEVENRTDGETPCAVCNSSGGRCRPENNSAAVVVCSHAENQVHLGRKIGIGVGAAAVSAITMCVIFYIYHRRYKKRRAVPSSISREFSSYPSLVKDLEKAGVHIFAYHELEEATGHFDPKRELGDGGYGAVYKGRLQDGRTVAVKRLYENHYRRVEQFMNEVEILTRLRHQNLVSLYGCTSCNVRELLLVYEYIPNGTLADHLHGTMAKPGSPSWITRLNIAIGTASALAYLHSSGVIHRDIKTTNILLDNNFAVKVADFGLSRLCPTDATHVSTAPQGTPGYVDPEYNEFYQLTEKSDVYSFGVVLFELISSQPAIDITRNRHEINLSTMAINKIQSHALHELVDPHLGFESDYKVRTMVVSVAELAFQCLQNGRETRPHMCDVLDILQEIQSKDYCTNVIDIPAEEDILLSQSNSPPVSSKSVATDCRV